LNHYLPNSKIIHIDIDPSEINKNVKFDIGINADAKEALNALLPYIACNSHPEWHQEFASEHDKEVRAIIKYETRPTDGEIKMA
ncbi:acetolactate synthase large subunit, partial [Francisella tularensis subsp. holarctica]|nr:acetolactate synthase large subunit [Francisella tularensis subsp. holarctica]